MDDTPTCCFTGHRDIPVAEREAIAAMTREKIRFLYERGVRRFLCGMALGYDTLAAREVMKLKHELPDLLLVAVVPCRDQAKRWSLTDKLVRERILETCDAVVTLAETYDPGCMQRRDRYMVDESDAVIAYLTHEGGGTAYTVSYAERKEKAVYILGDGE